MSRENPKKYPRSVESKNSFLRIRAPEHLDIALEGLIRKVLREQPKMDDIYTFAADYFDMLLKIREKAGIRKLSAQDICPYHTLDDAREMIKLASSFTKGTKPHFNTYKVLTLKNEDQWKHKKRSEKLESNDLNIITQINEDSDRFGNIVTTMKENIENEKSNETTESDLKESEVSYSVKVSGQEIRDEVFIKANEVVSEYNAEDEDLDKDLLGNGIEAVGDINELRDKITAVENEIKLLDKRENNITSDIADENAVGEILEETNNQGNAHEKYEENIFENGTENVKEEGMSDIEETEMRGNLAEEESQEARLLEEYQDTEVNTENVDVSDAKSEENLEEPRYIKTNTESGEEAQKPDVETGTEEVEPETHNVNTDDAEKVQKTESNTENKGKLQSEFEEVRSSGNEAEETKEIQPEELTDNQEITNENSPEIIQPTDPMQTKEVEAIGEEDLKTEKVEDETDIDEEKEAMKVQNFEDTNTNITKKDENPEVQEEDTTIKNERTEETKPTEEKTTSDSNVPVFLGPSLSGLSENVEGSVEELSSAEEIVSGNESKIHEMTTANEIEKFLDKEREYSSHEKEAQDIKLLHEIQKQKITDSNSIESEIQSRTVPELGTIKGQEELLLSVGDTSQKISEAIQKTDDIEPDDYDDSTTSGEIEFEVSQPQHSEADIGLSINVTESEKDEIHKDATVEPGIVLELNTEDRECEEKSEDLEKESNKMFLEVPGLILEENPHIKTEDMTLETEPVTEKLKDETILNCGNTGNEIIQKKEVDKVELVEGEEDILQVHLTTTFEIEQDRRDPLHVEMTSRIEPNFKVSVETEVESPIQDAGDTENIKLIRAAVVIQNGFRRFKKRKILLGELEEDDKQLNTELISHLNENELSASSRTLIDSYEDNNSSSGKENKIVNLNETRTLLETHSLDSIKKISPMKTRSLSSIRYGVADFEVWNQLVKELEEAATKIQSNYRGYKTRKKLQRENAVQSTATTSEDSIFTPDPENNQRHTGEFHDTLVLP